MSERQVRWVCCSGRQEVAAQSLTECFLERHELRPSSHYENVFGTAYRHARQIGPSLFPTSFIGPGSGETDRASLKK